MFIDNKYTKTYYQIIDRARARPKPSEYTENHHTIPQGITKYLELPESEKVFLTGREHWTVHHLLMKMVSGKLKAMMYYAFHMLGQLGKNRRIVNSKMYERIKIANRDAISGENNPNFGNHRKRGPNKKKRIPSTEEARKHMSEAAKKAHGRPEVKKKHSESGKIAQNRPEVKKRNSEAQKLAHKRKRENLMK